MGVFVIFLPSSRDLRATPHREETVEIAPPPPLPSAIHAAPPTPTAAAGYRGCCCCREPLIFSPLPFLPRPLPLVVMAVPSAPPPFHHRHRLLEG